MPIWPSTLPGDVLVASLLVRMEPNIAEFRPDVGQPLRRRRYAASRTVYSGDLLLRGAQIEILRDFFHVDCADGTLSFEMTDWWACAIGTPTTATFSFEQPPEFARVSGLHWRVPLVLSKIN